MAVHPVILRDPRAVVVSWAHYAATELTSQGTVSEDYITKTVPPCAALVSLRYYWHDELLRRTHPGHKKGRTLVRSATPDAFREEASAQTWAKATAAMAPLLHPALRMKWLYNDLDVKFLGLKKHRRRH